MKKLIVIFLLSTAINSFGQNAGERLAATALNIWKDSTPIGSQTTWSYDMAVVLKGLEGLWLQNGDGNYYRAIQKKIDYFINDDGSIKGYKKEDYNLDLVNNGKLVLLLYRITGKEKYKKAAELLRSQLTDQPRTKEGGFWHKKIYTNQMWLDGLYMAEPFYAEYAMLFHEDKDFDDIANQFIWIEKHTRDPKTGLLYHGWDESKEQQWANKQTGLSPQFWSRAMGWYADAIVDVLDYFPANHPKRNELIAILNRLTNALEKQQDKTTGLWYDVMNYNGPGKEKNYFEASGSSMFTYAIAKGVHKGYLPAAKFAIAQKAYAGILKKFIKEENGQTVLLGTVKGSGLGGKPYRDGSFAYYMSEPVITNDPKGMGAFILASNEMEIAKTLNEAKGKLVTLDRYFNKEIRKDVTGANTYWHYVWDEKSNSGFTAFQSQFEKYGAKLNNLDVAPTAANLKGSSVYIIVDPDNVRDNPNPNYMNKKDAEVIMDWVKAGGTLLLMTNDSANCDLHHTNILANLFGVNFTDKSINMVKNDIYEQGLVVPNDNSLFKHNYNMYLKEISALTVKAPAKVIAQKGEDVIMATASIGKGKVFAVGDPWLYNEYADGRKLPATFQNHEAGDDLVKWLLGVGKK